MKPGNYTMIVKIFSRIFLLYAALTLLFVYGHSVLKLVNPGAEPTTIKNSFFLFTLAMAGIAYSSVRKGLTVKPEFHLKSYGGILIISVMIIILFSILFNMLNTILPLPDLLENHINLKNQPIFIISAVFIAPVAEEIIFRGIITRDLLNYHSEKGAVVISGLLFGLIHVNPVQVLPATFAGFFLAWLYIRTNNLGLCIFLHFANNAMAIVILNVIPDDVLPMNRIHSFIILCLSIFLLCYFLFRLRRALKSETSEQGKELS